VSDDAPGVERANLDQQLISGIAWTAVWRWTGQVVSWGGTAYAARILTPGDYGLVGMAMLGIGLVRTVENFGMDAVLVQDRSIVGQDQARLAGFVILIGFLLFGTFAALSTPIAVFFRESQVAALVVALGLLCVSDALQVVPRATLQKELQYKRLAWAQFIQVLATQATLVAAAWLGLGVWSLVVNTLAGAFTVTLLLIYWRPYAIHWPRELSRLSKPLLQGWRILVSRFAWYAYSSADQTVVGRVLGSESLGIYSFSVTFSTTISEEITSVVSRVIPGVFTTVQHRIEELRRYFLLLTELVSLVAFPISFGTAAVADLMVPVVLGPQWDAVIAPLRLLCVYTAFLASQLLVGPILLWTGRFRANMWCSILAMVVMPISFYAGSSWGLIGIAWAWVIAMPIANLPSFIIAFRVIDIDAWKWLSVCAPGLVSSAVMVCSIALVRYLLPAGLPMPVTLLASIGAGVLAYVIALWLLFDKRVRRQIDLIRAVRAASATAPMA
jgi:teichuronic acid exporter